MAHRWRRQTHRPIVLFSRNGTMSFLDVVRLWWWSFTSAQLGGGSVDFYVWHKHGRAIRIRPGPTNAADG